MFWAFAFLLLPENAHHLAAIRQEINQAAAEEAAGAPAVAATAATSPTRRSARTAAAAGTPTVTTRRRAAAQSGPRLPDTAVRSAIVRLSLDRRTAAARCVAEAIRLRVHSIAIRLVPAGRRELVLRLPAAAVAAAAAAEDGGGGGRRGKQRAGRGEPAAAGASAVAERELRVPRGTLLAICPFVSHHDRQLYGGGGADPWAFDPDRAPIQMEPGAVASSAAGFGFGGGFWRCPGRFFAEMELSLLLMAAAQYLDLELPDQEADDDGSSSGGSSGGGGGLGARLAGAAAAAARAVLPARTARFAGLAPPGECGAFEAAARRWASSGDPGGRLPPAELRRLVGFKNPAAGLVVNVASRR
jgi:hypothetical protein